MVGVEEALTGSDYWEWLSGGTPVAVKTVGSGRQPSNTQQAAGRHTTVKLSNNGSCWKVKQNCAWKRDPNGLGVNLTLSQTKTFPG